MSEFYLYRIREYHCGSCHRLFVHRQAVQVLLRDVRLRHPHRKSYQRARSRCLAVRLWVCCTIRVLLQGRKKNKTKKFRIYFRIYSKTANVRERIEIHQTKPLSQFPATCKPSSLIHKYLVQD